MKQSKLIAQVRALVNAEEIRQLWRELSPHIADEDGHREAIAEIAAIVDESIDWSQMRLGLLGRVIEQGDGPIARALLTIVVRQILRGAAS